MQHNKLPLYVRKFVLRYDPDGEKKITERSWYVVVPYVIVPYGAAAQQSQKRYMVSGSLCSTIFFDYKLLASVKGNVVKSGREKGNIVASGREKRDLVTSGEGKWESSHIPGGKRRILLHPGK